MITKKYSVAGTVFIMLFGIIMIYPVIWMILLKELKQLPNKSIDLILTDPPYKQEFHGRGMSKDRPKYLKN